VMPSLVSTIIPVYNRPEMVVQAVNSVLSQTYRPIEIILVDDGSTDDTPGILDQLRDENPDIITVLHQPNQGPGLARETGRVAAHGDFIQYLDSDDWLLPDKFTIQVRALEDNPDCGITYGPARLVDQNGDTVREPSKWTGKRFDYLFPALLIDRWWHTHTPLFRKEISDAAGCWSEHRPEDWDLEARMGALRVKLIYCDTVLSCQREYPDENRVSWGSHEAYLRDEAWFLPRLYDCAVQAGITSDAPEMHHFSRWAFMRARHLGAMGETDLAQALYRLAQKSGRNDNLSMKVVGFFAKVLGWKLTGKLCMLREVFPGMQFFSAGRQ